MRIALVLSAALLLAGCGTMKIEKIDYEYVAVPESESGGYYLVRGSTPAEQRPGTIIRAMRPVAFEVDGLRHDIHSQELARRGDRIEFSFRVECPTLLELSPQGTRPIPVVVEFESEHMSRARADGTLPPRSPQS